MKSFIVNADYESQLYHHKDYPKWRLAIEFFFLWIEPKCFLSSTHSYSLEDIHFLTKSTGAEPLISSKTKPQEQIFWWGKLENKDLERKINSRLFIFDEARRLRLLPSETMIINNDSELKELPSDYLLKTEGAMSGKGIIKIELSSKKKMIFPLIAEPLFNRSKDFSCYVFNSEKKIIFYQNIVDEHFQFRGTLLGEGNISELMESSQEENLLESFPSKVKEIHDYILKQGATGDFSMDSFLYSKNDRTSLYGLTEINYRKTMGWVTWKLKNRFNSPWVFLGLYPKKDSRDKILNFSKQVILLSPDVCPFYWVLFLGNSKHEITELKIKFESTF